MSKTVFFDVDTQLDFVYPAGALYVPGAEDLVPALSALTQFAAANGIQIISTADSHAPDDEEFRVWKPHCVAETTGQLKAAGTLLEKRAVLDASLSAGGAPQIIVEKQKLDCFSNPHLMPFLKSLDATRYVVYGVVTEFCVQCAAFGLLELGKHVELVSDAICSLSEAAASKMLAQLQAEGGTVTNVGTVTG